MACCDTVKAKSGRDQNFERDVFFNSLEIFPVCSNHSSADISCCKGYQRVEMNFTGLVRVEVVLVTQFSNNFSGSQPIPLRWRYQTKPFGEVSDKLPLFICPGASSQFR